MFCPLTLPHMERACTQFGLNRSLMISFLGEQGVVEQFQGCLFSVPFFMHLMCCERDVIVPNHPPEGIWTSWNVPMGRRPT